MVASNQGNTIVKLNTSADWKKWIHMIKTTATAGKVDVWKYVDPANETPEPLPTEPTRPIPQHYNNLPNMAELRAQEGLFEHYRWDFDVYKWDYGLCSEVRDAVSKVGTQVNTTVTSRNYHYIDKETSVRGMLRALRANLSPHSATEMIRVRDEYRNLQLYDKRQNINDWLMKWENMYNEAISIDLPEVQGKRICFDFLDAIAPYDNTYATIAREALENRIEDGKEPRLADVIERFRQQVAKHSMNRHRSGVSHSTLSTYKSDSHPNRPLPRCECGRKHYAGQCFYMNKKIRPETWKPREEILKKIEKRLKEDVGFKTLVERSISIEMTNRKEKETASKSSSKVSDSTNSTNYKVLISTTIHFNASSDIYEHKLYRCWTLVMNADIHVVNHDEGFTHTRSPEPDEHVSDYKENRIQIEAFGTVSVTMKTTIGTRTITLQDVAYIPGFLTNVVALERLNRGGVHWDTSRPSILKKEGKTYGNLDRVGSHWVLQKDLEFLTKSHMSDSEMSEYSI